MSDVENVFDNYEEMFNFDAIGLPGKQNTSVSESVKQALFDKDIQNMMKMQICILFTLKAININH